MSQGNSLDTTVAREGPMSGPGPGALEAAIEAVLSRPAYDEAVPTVTTTSEADCPAFKVGAQIGRLVAAHSALDTVDSKDAGPEKHDRLRAMERCDASLTLLRQAMTWQIATSAGGALAQIVVAAQSLSDIIEHEDASKDDIEDYVAQVRRCLYSVSPVLAKLSGVSPRALGSDYLMARHIDHFRNAWSDPPATYVAGGPKPTVEFGVAQVPAFIEAQLVERNRIADEWWSAYGACGQAQDEAESSSEDDDAKMAMAELGSKHSIRILRENLTRAIQAPASTVRELGLQARLIAVELNEWWDGQELEAGEHACRMLLDRLMGLAGVAPINRGDVSTAEIRDWITNPVPHAARIIPDMPEARS